MAIKDASLYYTEGHDPKMYALETEIARHLELSLGKNKITVTDRDLYKAVALSVRDRMIRKWMRTQQYYVNHDVKKVFYLSMEYLMGRLLATSLINLDFYDECQKVVTAMGFDLSRIINQEEDMGLGNGGLGRLAACFLDSMATMEYPAYGYGIRYEYGIFRQDIQDGYQIERPDNWLRYGSPWEIMRPELTYRVRFGGKVTSYLDPTGQRKFQWIDTSDVLAMAYDIPVPGYRTDTVNNLRLWQAKSTHEFDFEDFNQGNYFKAVESKNRSENISKVLYPNDNVESGKELRLKQQYFFVSATLQDIIRKYKINHRNMKEFHKKNAIHLNDTHPTLAIPELMRILVDEEGLTWEDAWMVTKGTFAYTNHTIMQEALEKWGLPLFERLLPRHLEIIYTINIRFLERVRWRTNNDPGKLSRMSIIEEGNPKKVRMANLAIIGSHSVNGVAALHTEILKETIFNDFYNFQSKKFNNKTNGITQRRWLRKSNYPMTLLLAETIGKEWVTDLDRLRGLEQFADDKIFHERWRKAKEETRQRFIAYLDKEYHLGVNPDSIIDVQVKRMHEYKRQLLNALHVITMYNRIKDNPSAAFVPRTIVFGGKAAPGYFESKLIIKLINSIASVVNQDPDIGDKLKVVFVKNYGVSLAEIIIPATDLSEQISTAGYEASGTGNMKFMLNGAITIGTLDGANIEIKEEVGDENIFIFGMTAQEVRDLRSSGYNPQDIYGKDEELHRALNMIRDSYFNPYEPGIFQPLYDKLIYGGDYFCLLADYRAYIDAQERVSEAFTDKKRWTKMSILNTARAGKFSSDRTIRQYAEEIWKIKHCPILDDEICEVRF